jgi:hypothetical protein
MITLMVTNPLIPVLDLTSLRVVSCGGSPQSPTTIVRAIAAFGCEFFVSAAVLLSTPLDNGQVISTLSSASKAFHAVVQTHAM